MTVEPTAPAALPMSAVSSDEVVRTDPASTLAEVAALMVEQSVGAVLVGTVDAPVGVVSERDVVRAVAGGMEPEAITAGDLAHTELVWADPASTVAEVAEEMMEQWVRHVLVGTGGRVEGIVSARDLLGVFLAAADADLDGTELDGGQG